MRAYLVKVEWTATPEGEEQEVEYCVKKFAGSQSEVSAVKNEFVEAYGVKRKDCESEEVDIPTSKAELIAYLNELIG